MRPHEGDPSDGGLELSLGVDRKPDEGVGTACERVERLKLGERYGSYISERQVALPDLQLELESLKSRLDREVFFKVMVDFGRSDNYTPQDKAAIFNRLLPIKGNSSVYPVYQDVMLDWAAKGGEGGHFWSFVGHLESSELREYLARGYYASAAVDLAKLEEIIEFEADRQSESFLGRDYQARSRSLAQLVNSLVAGNVLSRAEVDGLLTRIDVDLGFKRDLTARLAAESNP